MSKSRKGGQGLTDLLTIAGLLSLSELTKGKKRVAKKKTGKKKAAKKTVSRKKPAKKVVKKKTVSRKKPAKKVVKKKKSVSRKKPAKKTVKRKKPVKKTVSRRKPAKKVVKRKKPVKKVVRRKKGGMMGTLAPHGVSASTAAFALAALSKADMKRSSRRSSMKKRKSKKKKGGECGSCTRQRGGRSDWKVVQFSRGPANYPNNGWSCGKKQFGTFTKTGQYVPNSQLAWQGWANPQLANTVSSQCK
jgi:hypothetical protein